MRRLLILLATASAIAGCASTPRICDGEDRRPINASVRAEVVYRSCGAAA